MSAGIKLLDKYAASCSLSRDKDIAQRLRVTKATVSGWRHGKAHPNPEAIGKMCTAISEPLSAWLPLIESERSRTPEDSKVWLRLVQGAAALAIAASITTSIDLESAAQALSLAVSAHSQGTLYIM